MIETSHQWRFFRAGGFDQVLLETADDLLALDQLDKKLWSALSCPVNGVEFDPRTLELIDSDGDGHIRVPEILAAISWSAGCLNDRSFLTGKSRSLPLIAINSDSPDGKSIFDATKIILEHLGKPECDSICIDDTLQIEAVLNNSRFNGDGVITPETIEDETTVPWVNQIIQCYGSVPDRNGEGGITKESIELFSTDIEAWLSWYDLPIDGKNCLPEESRDDSLALWNRLRSKIDDYFLRCGMAIFDQRALTVMNSSDENLSTLATRNLTEAVDEMALLPLANVSATATLPLTHGINPAWQDSIQQLKSSVIVPFLGDVDELTVEKWNDLKSAVLGYETWWSSKPVTTVAQLGSERLRQWNNDIQQSILALIEQDLAIKPVFEAIIQVERLTRYCRDLMPLTNNFVSFRDFYSGRGKAIFQSGTLFLDGRSFDLCITVTDVSKHALLANLSRVYLVYCDCIRHGGADKMTVVAGITDGDADQLLVGRNGVFYDRQGGDWDATIVRIIEHPISIKQAFWDPYKRIGKMVGEQLQKLAAARSKAAEEKAATGIMQVGNKKEETKQQPPFDAGKFAGIFAAIGLAIGAIGTAIASILTGFFKLPWWQMPLALIGIMLLVSGPSVAIAWFKLRQRNLGRLLDANGWAVNTRARINIPFGASLTGLARLPQGAIQTISDPFAEKKTPWKRWLYLLMIVAAVVIAWQYGYFK